METRIEFQELDKLSLTDAETLLEQEMDELLGGDNYYYCTCSSGACSA